MNHLPHDIKMAILLKMDGRSIERLSLVNKQFYSMCNNDLLWQSLLNRDFTCHVSLKAKYKKLDTHFDKYTQLVIAKFIRFGNGGFFLENVYDRIKQLLVEYVNFIKSLENPNGPLFAEYIFPTLKQVFCILRIPIKSVLTIDQIRPFNKQSKRITDKDKFCYLGAIFCETYNNFKND